LPKQGSVTDVRYLTPALIALGRGDRAKQEPGAFELWDLTSTTRKEPYYSAPLGVRAVAVVPHRKRVAWLEWGRKLAVWDIVKPSATHIGLAQNAIALAFHPDGHALALACGWEVHTYDLEAKTWRATLRGHKGVVPSTAYTPDGHTLATASWDGTVRFWDPHTGGERAAFQWPIGRVYALAFSPDGLRVAAAGDAGLVVVWDAA
jgi:WD40 repeat protein